MGGFYLAFYILVITMSNNINSYQTYTNEIDNHFTLLPVLPPSLRHSVTTPSTDSYQSVVLT